jgi:ATP-dependent DNA helicase 2 subunit 2
VTVPPRAKGKRARDLVTPLSGLNLDKLLQGVTPKISADNAIPGYKQRIERAEDPNAIADATKQMSTIILKLVKDSFSDTNYGQALANLAVMKQQLIEYEEPEMYNDFIIELKKQILANELNGDRKDFFWEIKKKKLGLIDQKTSEVSEVTEEEAAQVSDIGVHTATQY